MDRSTKLVAAFIFLFALPFAAFGLSTLAKAISQMISGTGDSPVWLPLIFGLVFSGIGCGLIFVAFFGAKLLKRQNRLQAEHPAEPWLWREDWAQGRIKGNTQSGMIGGWIFAVFWNLISAPILVIIPREAAKKPVAYLGLLFPVIGVFLLIRAIRLTLAYLEFGKTCFEMAPVPGVIGGDLKGMIQARFPHSLDHGIQLRLSCVERVTTGSGDSQSTSEHILWRAEQNLSSGQLYPGPAGTSIPVNFRIPWDAQATETRGPRDAILWQLEALADVPGVNYHDLFDVPVFRTAQTPAQRPPDALTTETVSASKPTTLSARITETAAGTEFFFPAARNKGFAMGTTTFLLIFGAVAFFLARSSAPVIFPLVFGFFALLLLYFVVQMWLGTSRVGINGGAVLVQDGLFGGGKIRRFALSELASISSTIRSQQSGGTGTPYYDIELNLRTGRKVTLARTIKNKQEVDWLIEEMRRLTGLQPKAASAGA